MVERELKSPRLVDLPVQRAETFFGEGGGPRDEDGSGIVAKYRTELDKVRTPKQLRAFVKRWNVVWQLDGAHFPRTPPSYAGYLLVSGRFNAAKVLRTLRKITRTYSGRGKSRHWRVAVAVRIPPPFVSGALIARRFGVPIDLALVQLYQGVEFL